MVCVNDETCLLHNPVTCVHADQEIHDPVFNLVDSSLLSIVFYVN